MARPPRQVGLGLLKGSFDVARAPQAAGGTLASAALPAPTTARMRSRSPTCVMITRSHVHAQHAARRIVDLEAAKLGKSAPGHLRLRDVLPPPATARSSMTSGGRVWPPLVESSLLAAVRIE
jgi:hypothetical protein